MFPDVISLYGPIAIKSYGLCICIGLMVFMKNTYKFLVSTHIVSENHFLNLMINGIIAAIIGGRFLFLACNWQEIETIVDILAVWQGGFSILGSIIAVTGVTLFYVKFHQLNTYLIMDRFALFAPLLQSISRIGCFFSGCCWGTTHYPLQLYSSCCLFIIFLFLYAIHHHALKLSGLIMYLYLLFVGCERFFLDFWRGQREFFTYDFFSPLSINQWISLLIIMWSFYHVSRLIKNYYESLFIYQKSTFYP